MLTNYSSTRRDRDESGGGNLLGVLQPISSIQRHRLFGLRSQAREFAGGPPANYPDSVSVV